jgi:hypothetical protein
MNVRLRCAKCGNLRVLHQQALADYWLTYGVCGDVFYLAVDGCIAVLGKNQNSPLLPRSQ